MATVALKELQAETIAHLLDDFFRIPGTRTRIGADPLLGFIPVVGDALATVWGAAILVIARQLRAPWRTVIRMAYNQFKNGVIGAIPFLGDVYSIGFKSNVINAALLLRTVRAGEEGRCPLQAFRLTPVDLLMLGLLVLPTVSLVLLISFWFWEHNISYLSLFFPPLHLTP